MNKSLKSIAIVKMENDDMDTESFTTFINTLNFYFTEIYLIDGTQRRSKSIKNGSATKMHLLYRNLDKSYIHFVSQPPTNLTCYNFYVLLTKAKTYLMESLKPNSTMCDDKDRNMLIYTNHLTISSNVIREEHLNIIVQQQTNFFATSSAVCTVIVFDLDDTLIDDKNQPLVSNLAEFIDHTRTIFDYVVLWSHGTCEHVHSNLKMYKLQKSFDLVISRNYNENTKNKSIGLVFKELHKKFNISQISMCALVDDLKDNFNEDYDYYLQVPRSNAKTVEKYYKFAFEKLQCLIFNNVRNRIISW